MKTTKQWHNRQGKLHRSYGKPAIVGADGHKEWYTDGKRDRLRDLPAIIRADGTHEYYSDGKLHNTIHPAIIRANGTREFYQHGLRHSLGDLPAYASKRGEYRWYWKGVLHREGGKPSAIHPDGSKTWHLLGILEKELKANGDVFYYYSDHAYLSHAIIDKKKFYYDKKGKPISDEEATCIVLINPDTYVFD